MYKNENVMLFNNDCLEVMEELLKRNVKVDAVIADIPAI